ncbi:MAG: hypothetical protein HYR64_09990 [Fimbriimonas ginsengisoli]|uniref:Uncharacterized protein n=1 Tax=Fimbriimonas ginsengisoli TaxID=1005039 RepID=A0A931PUI0_FIMGI|nr:hypothetical protein [Fimbriimonas ginsengisoli]
MKNSTRIALLAIGLAAIASVGGWKSLRRTFVNAITDAEVKSMPGDTPGTPTRFAFSREFSLGLAPGSFSSGAFMHVVGASEIRIQTVTVDCSLPVGQSPSLTIILFADQEGQHHIAMQQQGYFTQGGTLFVHWVGTHEVSIWARSGVFNPADVFASVLFLREGGSTGATGGNVTITGYATPLPPPIDITP